MVVYNEINPYAAEWLRNLGAAGLIEPGDVCETDVRVLDPDVVRGARQYHAFAGIGVWSYALRLAGWPAARPVWTGSCPCQPFSQAGRKRGVADDRHLWPAWHRLIVECRPPIVFGEQVASPDGRSWLDTVRADLEALDYAFGAADLCAAGVGAPHVRPRLFFVAIDRGLENAHVQRRQELGLQLQPGQPRQTVPEAAGRGQARGLGNASSEGRLDGPEPLGRRLAGPPGTGATRGLAFAAGTRRKERARGTELSAQVSSQPDRQGVARGLGDANGARGGRDPGAVPGAEREGPGQRFESRHISHELVTPGATRGFWSRADWLVCRDGRARPVEPGSFPLAHGVAGRVAVRRASGSAEEEHWYNRRAALEAIGNAIVPQVAAIFVRAVMDYLGIVP